MEFMGVAGVAAISVIAYLIGEAVKISPLENRYIPLICGVSGAILGAAAMYTVPDFPAEDMLNAVAIDITVLTGWWWRRRLTRFRETRWQNRWAGDAASQ